MLYYTVLHFLFIIETAIILWLSFYFFLKERYFIFFFTLFIFFYLFLRPILVLIGLHDDYRPLYHFQDQLPSDYWYTASIIGFLGLFSIFIFYIVFKSKDYAYFYEAEPPKETTASRLSFIFSSIVSFFLVVHASYYLVMAYMLRFKTTFSTKFYSSIFLIFYLSTTVERRDIMAFLIFIILLYLRSIVQKSKLKKKTVQVRTRFLPVIALTAGLFLVAILSVFYRNPHQVLQLLSWRNVTTIVEIQLDFPIVYDELHFLVQDLPSWVLPEENFGLMFIKAPLGFLPREIFPEKPETSSRTFAKRYNKLFYAGGGSLPTTLIGDTILSFGILCAGGLLLAALYLRFIITILPDNRLSMIFLNIMSFFLVRGPFDGVIFGFVGLMMYQIVFAILLTAVKAGYTRNVVNGSSLTRRQSG